MSRDKTFTFHMRDNDGVDWPMTFRGGDHRAQWLSYSCIDKEHSFCTREDCRCDCHVKIRK